MNRMGSQMGGEARLRYLDADFDVLAPGSYVTCAVTGQRSRWMSSATGASTGRSLMWAPNRW